MATVKTVKAFAEQSNIPAPLIRAVVRQIGGWSEFKESAADVANHGADGGFGGFIYYSDTMAFTKRQLSNIRTLAKDQASDFGTDSISMIAGFNCLNNYDVSDVADALLNPRSDCRKDVYNALAWYALEEVARSYVELCDQ